MTGVRPAAAVRLRRAVSMALAIAAVSFALGPRIGEAHHAWNEIDPTKTATLTGTVRSLKWENPHASLVLETVDGSMRTEWTVLMSGLSRMEARGVRSDTVAAGRRLTIVCSPARDEPHVVRANRIRSDDGAEHVLY